MKGVRIEEKRKHNLKNYDETYKTFNWKETEKEFSWYKTGRVNMSHEAI